MEGARGGVATLGLVPRKVLIAAMVLLAATVVRARSFRQLKQLPVPVRPSIKS